jgi:hypothetical protein
MQFFNLTNPSYHPVSFGTFTYIHLGNIYLSGGLVSALYSSSNGGYSWNQVILSGSFPVLWGSSVVSFSPVIGTYASKQIVVYINGLDNSNIYSTVWISPDNAYWTRIDGTSTDKCAGYNSAAIVVQRRIWVVGGGSNDYGSSRVCYSDDGYTFNSLTAPWPARQMAGVSMDSSGTRLIVAGGVTMPNTDYNDVWISDTTGSSWQQLPNLPFTGRVFSMAYSKGYSYIVGGESGIRSGGPSTYYNDVWVTPDDGYSWMLVTSNPYFSPRPSYLRLVALGSRMVSFGTVNSDYSIWTGIV